MSDTWKASDFVFVAARTGGMLNPSTLVDAFKRALKKAELPATFRFHGLRHGRANFLIAQNIHAKAVSAILGHASIQITMNLYGDSLPGAANDAAERVSRFIAF